jgi:hypothetical protein
MLEGRCLQAGPRDVDHLPLVMADTISKQTIQSGVKKQ